MFEALETGKHLTEEQFKAQRAELRPALLEAQFELAERDYPLIVVMGGFDGAGKGAVVHRFNEWMDPRLIETHALWMHSDEEETRPYFWRFWRRLPPRGRTGIMLGNWYQRAAYRAMAGSLDEDGFELAMRRALAFERMLVDDGALVVKLWLHVSRDMQRRQLSYEAPRQHQNPRVPTNPEAWWISREAARGEAPSNAAPVPADPAAWWARYPRALEVSEQLIRLTDSGEAPWHLIEADDSYYRDTTAAGLLLRAMRNHEPANGGPVRRDRNAPGGDPQPTILDAVDLSRRVPREEYRPRLAKLQGRIQDLFWQAHREHRSLVAVFEGWDAAGKGSAIRRLTAAVDPRLYMLVQFAAPTDEERAHHYLWRFWRRLQRDGRATLFDRSWYGRVLVERVEELTPPATWRRAYSEINDFESQLVEHGCIVAKFWLHISKDEQLKRFEDREAKPHKQHKITDEDWRNREKWDNYALAVEDMVANTSTGAAPWHLVAGNDKKAARLEILELLCEHFESHLGA